MNFFFLISVHYHYLYAIIALYHNQVQYQKVFSKNQFKILIKNKGIRVFFWQNQKFNTEWNMYCNIHIIYITDCIYYLYYTCMKEYGGVK